MSKNVQQKHLCQSLFLKEPEGCNFIEKEALTQLFSFQFFDIFRNTLSQRTPHTTNDYFCIELSNLKSFALIKVIQDRLLKVAH